MQLWPLHQTHLYLMPLKHRFDFWVGMSWHTPAELADSVSHVPSYLVTSTRHADTRTNVDTSAHIRISAAVFILNLESMPYTGWTMNISEAGHFAACIILSDWQPGWSPFFTLSSFFHWFFKNLTSIFNHTLLLFPVISPLPSFSVQPQTGKKRGQLCINKTKLCSFVFASFLTVCLLWY